MNKTFSKFIDKKYYFSLGLVFYTFFLLLVPLGVFNDWIPVGFEKGYYNISRIDPGDDTGYYAYLRSGFFDGDWDFLNEKNYAHSEHFTPTGYVFDNWQIGQALLFLPFFLAGHILALTLNGLGLPITVDGYSEPYFFATGIAAQTYVFIGVCLLFHTLKRFYRASTALSVSLAVWLGSPLLYYTFIRQRMAHASEFFLAAVFLYFWLRSRDSNDRYQHALLGALLGLLCLVRISNACYLFLYFSDQIWQGWLLRKREDPNFWKIPGIQMSYFAVFWFMMFSPQLYTWIQFSGSPISYFSKIMDIVHGGMSSSGPKTSFLFSIWQFFFMGPWPFVFSIPLWFLGFLGVIFLRPISADLRPGFLIFLIMMILLLVTTGYSAAYGIRNMTLATPVFALGLAASIEKFFHKHRASFVFFLLFMGFCIFFQYWMIVQYRLNLEYNDPRFTAQAWHSLTTLIAPSSPLGESFKWQDLLRSTNFIRLMFLNHPVEWDYRDVLFLVVFPLGQLLSIAAVIFVSHYGSCIFKRPYFDRGSKRALMVAPFLALTLLYGVSWFTPEKSPEARAGRERYSKLMKEGNERIAQRKLDEAKKVFSVASRLIPQAWNPDIQLAEIYTIQDKHHDAHIYFKKALQKIGSNSIILRYLGINLIKMGKYKDAEKILLTSYKYDRTDKYTNAALGEVYANLKNYQKCKKFYKQAVEIDPSYKEGHMNLAILFANLGQKEEGQQHLLKAVKLGANGPKVSKLATTLGMEIIWK